MKKIFLLTLLLVISSQISAQKKEKPFTDWSNDYALKILKESPWAKSYQSTQGLIAAEQAQVTREQDDQRIARRGVSRERYPVATTRNYTAPIVIRLNSALPVRQALVRLQQIAANYDKMNEKERAEFDNVTRDFLKCAACEKFYVITLTKFKNSGEGVDEGLFQSMRFEDLKGKVTLFNEKGEKRELVQFIPPKKDGESAVFFFQRNDSDGHPLISPENKEMTFVFSTDFLDNRNPYARFLPRRFEFNVSKLVSGESVMF